MAGVNDWRFRLAEEEDRRRRKFGLGDLLSFLQTAAGIGTSIAGLKQSGERQALAQEQFDYGKAQDVLDAERQARLDAIAKEKHETGMHEAGYFRADPAMQEPMPSTAQTTSTGMTRLPGYLEDMAGRGAMEDRQALFDEYSSNLPTGAELLPTGGGGYRGVYPPDYGQGAGGEVPSGPRPTDVRLAYKDIKNFAENDVTNAHPEAWVDGPNGRTFMWTPELQAEATQREQSYMNQPQYANLFNLADPMNDPTNPETRATAKEIALSLDEGDADTFGAMTELELAYPMLHGLVLHYQRLLADIKQAEPTSPSASSEIPGGFATAGSTYAPPPFPPSPADTTEERTWRTIQEILGG